jgi:steroid delta-isomerase-like uncharacterized protein
MLLRLTMLVGLALVTTRAGANAQADSENKRVVRHVFEQVWNEARFDSLHIMWAPDAPFHFRGSASPVGPDGVERTVRRWRGAFPDLRFVVEDLIGDGDRVAARLTFTGTHAGRFQGIDPTGRLISVTEMMFFRFDDGLVVEAWEDYYQYGMLQQLTRDAGAS